MPASHVKRRIAVVRIQHNKEHGNFAVYGMVENRVCVEQRFFPYVHGTRTTARAAARGYAQGLADASKAKIVEVDDAQIHSAG